MECAEDQSVGVGNEELVVEETKVAQVEGASDSVPVGDSAMDEGVNRTEPSGEGNIYAENGTNGEGVTSPSAEGVELACCAPAPEVEVKLFVGRLPRSYTEDMVRPLFEQFGSVVEVSVIRDKTTQNHKGSAFVRMASLCQADGAIRALNNVKVLETSLGALTVKYALGEVENLGLPPSAQDSGADQAKLFVGSLPKTVSDEQIREVFAKFGKIDEIFIMKDTAGNGKGCAFVKFAYKEQAIYAVNELNGKMTFPGAQRLMEVRFAVPKRNAGEAPVGAMATPYPVSPMGAMGGGYGGMGPRGPPNNAAPRQAGAWKEYISVEGRPYYHNDRTGITQWDRPMEFDDGSAGGYHRGGMGGSRPGVTEATGPVGANIFVFHIPNEWTEVDLYRYFGQFGSILSARIAQDRQTGRNRGFAFVSFSTAESAANAVANMNGFMACGKRLKVTIKKGEETGAAEPTATPQTGQSIPHGAAVTPYRQAMPNAGMMGNINPQPTGNLPQQWHNPIDHNTPIGTAPTPYNGFTGGQHRYAPY